MIIEIDKQLKKLDFAFKNKPLLFGGMAMEFYGLRDAGADIDLIISEEDHAGLRVKYPDNIKDLYGDLGICEYKFEIWNQVCRFKYEDLILNALEQEHFLVVSLEKLVLLKTIAIKVEKSERDLRLLSQYILDIQYGKKKNI